jgi:hypothetical protein
MKAFEFSIKRIRPELDFNGSFTISFANELLYQDWAIDKSRIDHETIEMINSLKSSYMSNQLIIKLPSKYSITDFIEFLNSCKNKELLEFKKISINLCSNMVEEYCQLYEIFTKTPGLDITKVYWVIDTDHGQFCRFLESNDFKSENTHLMKTRKIPFIHTISDTVEAYLAEKIHWVVSSSSTVATTVITDKGEMQNK